MLVGLPILLLGVEKLAAPVADWVGPRAGGKVIDKLDTPLLLRRTPEGKLVLNEAFVNDASVKMKDSRMASEELPRSWPWKALPIALQRAILDSATKGQPNTPIRLLPTFSDGHSAEVIFYYIMSEVKPSKPDWGWVGMAGGALLLGVLGLVFLASLRSRLAPWRKDGVQPPEPPPKTVACSVTASSAKETPSVEAAPAKTAVISTVGLSQSKAPQTATATKPSRPAKKSSTQKAGGAPSSKRTGDNRSRRVSLEVGASLESDEMKLCQMEAKLGVSKLAEAVLQVQAVRETVPIVPPAVPNAARTDMTTNAAEADGIVTAPSPKPRPEGETRANVKARAAAEARVVAQHQQAAPRVAAAAAAAAADARTAGAEIASREAAEEVRKATALADAARAEMEARADAEAQAADARVAMAEAREARAKAELARAKAETRAAAAARAEAEAQVADVRLEAEQIASESEQEVMRLQQLLEESVAENARIKRERELFAGMLEKMLSKDGSVPGQLPAALGVDSDTAAGNLLETTRHASHTTMRTQ